MISFRFKGKTYMATISNLKPGEVPAYKITLYNENLQKILPDITISFSHQEIGMLVIFKHPSARQLLYTIHESLSNHLKCREEHHQYYYTL